jgi:sortase A
MIGNLQSTSLASSIPTMPPIHWQDPTEGEKLLPIATEIPTWIPDRIVISAIQLDTPVKLATLNHIVLLGNPYQQWVPPNFFAAGWLATSAALGGTGNTVLIGHHNVHGEVFRHLVDLKVGDVILVYSGDKEFSYVITQRMILPERDQSLDVRLRNAQWIAPSQDERLTLVTCWPYENNTHRLIIVAKPENRNSIENAR